MCYKKNAFGLYWETYLAPKAVPYLHVPNNDAFMTLLRHIHMGDRKGLSVTWVLTFCLTQMFLKIIQIFYSMV